MSDTEDTKKLDAMTIDIVYLPDGTRSYQSEENLREWELFGRKELYESLGLEVPEE